MLSVEYYLKNNIKWWVRMFNDIKRSFSGSSSYLATWEMFPSSEENGRFYTRGRIIRLDELGQTFVVRPVMRL